MKDLISVRIRASVRSPRADAARLAWIPPAREPSGSRSADRRCSAPEITTMTKLSDTALVILSTACQREGARVLPLTANLKGGAINVVLGSLHKRGLIEAIPAEAGDEVWGEQDDAP